MQLATTGIDKPPPEQPAALALARKLKAWGTPYTDGGYEAQPYILSEELRVVRNTEIEFKERQAHNLRLRAQFYEQQLQKNRVRDMG